MLYEFAGALGWPISKPVTPIPQPIITSPPPQAVHVPVQTVQPQSQRQKPDGGIEIIPKVGSIIRFGNYDWRVLDVKDYKMLVLSNKIINVKAFHSGSSDRTWATCRLRNELNFVFYNEFNAKDKARISESRVETNDNPWYTGVGGSATNDNAFLLSIEEVVRYFGDSGKLLSKNSSNCYFINDQFNSARIAIDTNGKVSQWWLRSPGTDNSNAAFIREDGSIGIYGRQISRKCICGVRPALWLKL
jgi:hypothetical protein